jgi:thiosulfate dehydrogenase (quinone) large subunit
MDDHQQLHRRAAAQSACTLFLRIALAAAFLSAVADRFGIWGRPGTPGVAWGNFATFEAYTALLNWFLPHSLIPALAWFDTALEILLGVLLLLGLATRATSMLSGVLLLLFALAMTFSTGLESALSYSVFSASAGAFLLAFNDPYCCSLDNLLAAKKRT